MTSTPMDRVKSEAGIGKAYLKEMGIQPWRLVQPNFPPEIINKLSADTIAALADPAIKKKLAHGGYLTVGSTPTALG